MVEVAVGAGGGGEGGDRSGIKGSKGLRKRIGIIQMTDL